MTTPRIDVAYRVYDAASHAQIDVDWGNPSVSGSPVTITMTAGLYMSAADLAAELEARLTAAWATPTWTVTAGSDGTFSISASAGVFTIEWDSDSMREWFGWDADITTPASSSTADNVCPGVFVGQFPWGNDAVGWQWARKEWAGHHQRHGAIKLARVRRWEVDAVIAGADLAQWRTVSALLMRGMPATWFRNASDTSAWAWDNFDGAVEVVLDGNSLTETQASGAHDNVLRLPLRFTEWADPSVATVSGFDSAMTAPELGLRFYLYAQGIGKVFIDGESFVNQASTLWTAPTDKASQSYTLEPYTLDTSGGIRDVGSEISRRSGEVSPGSMTITLSEDRDGTLLDLFALEKASGNVATLTDDLAYDTAGTGSVVTVDTTSGWASSGLAYIGRETIYYPAIASTTIGTSGSKATRDLFNDPNGTGTTYGDIEYIDNPARPQGPRIIRDWPSVWLGRWVSLRAVVVDPFGRAIGSQYDDSTWTSEVWRGRIAQEPRPADDWQRWTLQCDEITAIIDTDVGREPIAASLIKLVGAPANSEGELTPWLGLSDEGIWHITSQNNEFNIEITEWAHADYPDSPATVATVDAILTAGTYRHSELIGSLQSALDLAIASAGLTAAPTVAVKGYADGNHQIFIQTTAGGYTVQVTLFPGAPQSILPALGYGSSAPVAYTLNVPNPPAAVSPPFAIISPSSDGSPVYIGKDAAEIPFFYAPTGGTQGDVAASSGYARIGGENGEVVRYTSITDATATLDGMYIMNVAERGAMGTTAREHYVEWRADWTDVRDAVKVEFATAFADVHPLSAILQLATSTGSAHHGAYDTLIRRTAPPLDPQHFDTAQWANAIVDMDAPRVTMFMTKPRKLSELVASWLAPFGRFLYATRRDGLYRIQVGEMLPSLLSEPATTISSGHLGFFDPARWKGGLSRVVNQIEVYPTWDTAKEEFTESRITVENADSVQDYGVKGRLTWKLTGVRVNPLTVAASTVSWAARVFARLSQPYLVLEVTTGRGGLDVRPGDQVALTLPGVPALDGTRGISERRAVVLQASYQWESAIDSDSATGATLVLAIERQVKHSTYSPSAYVTSYSAGTPSITIDPTAGLFATGDTAEDHFDAGDTIVVFNGGDASTRDSLTIVSVSGNVITLNTTLTNASMVSGNTIVVAEDYSTSQASQRLHAYIADASTRPSLPSSTDPFRYV